MLIKEHQICMLIPAGCTVDANTIDLQGGILVAGALRGRVHCATGSAVIVEGGEFQGSIEANDIIVAGKITSPMDKNGKTLQLSTIKARGQKDERGRIIGGIVALSESSFVCAQITAVAFSIPKKANLSRSVLKTIVA